MDENQKRIYEFILKEAGLEAAEYFKKYKSENCHNIDTAFTWDYTPQNHTFWLNLHTKYEQSIKVSPQGNSLVF